MWNDTVGLRDQITYSNVLPVCESEEYIERVFSPQWTMHKYHKRAELAPFPLLIFD